MTKCLDPLGIRVWVVPSCQAEVLTVGMGNLEWILEYLSSELLLGSAEALVVAASQFTFFGPILCPLLPPRC